MAKGDFSIHLRKGDKPKVSVDSTMSANWMEIMIDDVEISIFGTMEDLIKLKDSINAAFNGKVVRGKVLDGEDA